MARFLLGCCGIEASKSIRMRFLGAPWHALFRWYSCTGTAVSQPPIWVFAWKLPDTPRGRIQTLSSVMRKSMFDHLCVRPFGLFVPSERPWVGNVSIAFTAVCGEASNRRNVGVQCEEKHTYLKPNILETANYPFTMRGFNLKQMWIDVFPIDEFGMSGL